MDRRVTGKSAIKDRFDRTEIVLVEEGRESDDHGTKAPWSQQVTKSHRPRQGDVDATPRRLSDLFSEDAPNLGGEKVSGSPTDAGSPAPPIADDFELALG